MLVGSDRSIELSDSQPRPAASPTAISSRSSTTCGSWASDRANGWSQTMTLDVARLLHRLRLRYFREAAPAVLVRAADEGWDYAQVLKVLLAEEAAGRDHSTHELHRKAARLPSGKTFDAWNSKASAIPDDAQWALRSLDWIGADEAEALYRLIDAAYEKRSLIVTSNLHPARFDTIFPRGLATAAVDRLLHHAHVIVTEGQSHRLTEAIAGNGVRPLVPAP
jgi:DNA replication protein DnaC